MIDRKEIQNIVSEYKDPPLIGCFGSHSAIEIATSAKRAGFKTYLIAQKGRDALYMAQYPYLFDQHLRLDNFSELLEHQEDLRESNVIMIPNRSLFVYLDRDKKGSIENDFKVPIYGSRNLLAAEDRSASPNQYDFMKKAGVPIPETIEEPWQIDEVPYPVIVKVQQKERPLERAFLIVNTHKRYSEVTEQMIEKGLIDREDLKEARMEEYTIGPYYNVNSHVLTLLKGEEDPDTPFEFDFVGFGRRDQTSNTGFLNLPASVQLELEKTGYTATMEEAGHMCVTMRESLIPQTMEVTEKIIEVLEEEVPPGMIGMLGVQGALPIDKERKPVFKVFDLSLRVPGDPAIAGGSPYMAPLNTKYESMLSRIHKTMPSFKLKKIEAPLDLTMAEIACGYAGNNLDEIVT